MGTNNRNLSAAEYFHAIQREYLIADFRRRIYYSPKDKAYYRRVMDYKAAKINSIAERNNLISILNSEDKRKEIHEELFERGWNPKFEMTETDRKNYYLVGNEFSYQGGIWVLEAISENGVAKISQKANNSIKEVQASEICRIL